MENGPEREESFALGPFFFAARQPSLLQELPLCLSPSLCRFLYGNPKFPKRKNEKRTL
uniref:Uncharacterized protein n=1 Tax=mine drainage metagenome TaxID=410659 RepID=E6PZD7_9ZZZZ